MHVVTVQQEAEAAYAAGDKEKAKKLREKAKEEGEKMEKSKKKAAEKIFKKKYLYLPSPRNKIEKVIRSYHLKECIKRSDFH